MLSRLVIATEGPAEGCLQLQQTLSAFPAAERASLASLVSFVAAYLARLNQYPAAIRHFGLAVDFNGPTEEIVQSIGAIQRDVSISPWLKNSYELRRPLRACRSHSKSGSTRRWTGPRRDSGPRPPRPLKSSRRRRGPVSKPTGTPGCAASGSPTMMEPSTASPRDRTDGQHGRGSRSRSPLPASRHARCRRSGGASPTDLAGQRPPTVAQGASRRSHR